MHKPLILLQLVNLSVFSQGAVRKWLELEWFIVLLKELFLVLWFIVLGKELFI